MGVLQDQIAAIRANNALSEEEKRAQIAAVKVNGLRDYIGFVDSNKVARYIGKSFVYNGMTLTVRAVGVASTNPPQLVVTVTRTLNGVTETDDFYITNPPILAADRTENLLVVVGEMLTSFPFRQA